MLAVADALGVGAVQGGVGYGCRPLGHGVGGVVLPLEQAAYECHSDELAVLHLAEICRAGVVVDLGKYLVDPRQGVEDRHVLLCERHAAGVEYEAVLDPVELVLVEEALFLHPRHVEHVEFGNRLVEAVCLAVLYAHAVAYVLPYVVGKAQGVGGDQHYLHALVSRQGLDEGVYGAAEAQVSAEAYRDAVYVSELPLDRQQVGQGLGGVAVASVSGVDYRYARDFRRGERGSLDIMAHGDYVGEAAYDAYRVLYGLALAHRGALCVRESEHAASEFQHRGCEAQAGAGAGLIEQGRELAVRHERLVCRPVGDYVFRHCDYLVGLLPGEVHGVYKVLHSESLNSRICCFCAPLI